MGFAQTDQTQEDDIGFVVDELQPEQILDLQAVDFLGMIPVEGVQSFDDFEPQPLLRPGSLVAR